MPTLLQGVTPSFYAFSQEIAYRAYCEHKLILRAFLEQEEVCYKKVFVTYVQAIQDRANKAIVRDGFVNLIWEDGLINVKNEIAVKGLCRPVFDYYWRFASVREFWLPNKTLMPYPDFLALWQEKMIEELSQQDRQLERLQEVLQQ